MSKNSILYLAIGLLAGFWAGFVLANNVNLTPGNRVRTGSSSVATQGDVSPAGVPPPVDSAAEEPHLTEDELRRAIAKGDDKPEDATLQRNLGRGLYLYAVQARNPSLLSDAIRFLKRAHDHAPSDRDITVTLGNALFDLGQAKDENSYAEARKYYLKALETAPNDVDVRTDLGLTYYFGKPPDPKRAIGEYRKSLSIKPEHEPTLQHLAAALIATGNFVEAQQRIEQLQKVNSANKAIPNLRAQLAQSKNAATEQQ